MHYALCIEKTGGFHMLSINSIARVVVNTVRSSVSPAAFDTGLI